MRVALYVHGRARGHASRAVTVARALRAAGHIVVAFAGGAARAWLAEEGLGEVHEREPIGAGPLGWRELARRVPRERVALRGFDVAIADGDQPSLLAAWLEAIPSIAVGHDLVLSSCELPDGLPRRALFLERANTAITTHTSLRRIAVHFLPARPLDQGTVVARPDVPARPLTTDGPVVAYLSAWDPERALAAALSVFPRVVCFGSASSRPGLEVRAPDREAFLDALARAPFVIATSGSNVLAECVTYGKPVLALHDVAHHEQSLNAALVEHAGVGIARRLDRVTTADVEALTRATISRLDLATLLPPLSEVIVAEVGRLTR